MPKDRNINFDPAADVRIIFERSSAHPVEYAIMLLVSRDGEWHTACTFDNAHDLEEHHEHRYLANEKQEPIVTYGSPNEAMGNALERLLKDHQAMVEEWEQTRE